MYTARNSWGRQIVEVSISRNAFDDMIYVVPLSRVHVISSVPAEIYSSSAESRSRTLSECNVGHLHSWTCRACRPMGCCERRNIRACQATARKLGRRRRRQHVHKYIRLQLGSVATYVCMYVHTYSQERRSVIITLSLYSTITMTHRLQCSFRLDSLVTPSPFPTFFKHHGSPSMSFASHLSTPFAPDPSPSASLRIPQDRLMRK
jgi:hypothetical protein